MIDGNASGDAQRGSLTLYIYLKIKCTEEKKWKKEMKNRHFRSGLDTVNFICLWKGKIIFVKLLSLQFFFAYCRYIFNGSAWHHLPQYISIHFILNGVCLICSEVFSVETTSNKNTNKTLLATAKRKRKKFENFVRINIRRAYRKVSVKFLLIWWI